jgi:hypothetical protein
MTGRGTEFSLDHRIQTGSGTIPASYPISTNTGLPNALTLTIQTFPTEFLLSVLCDLRNKIIFPKSINRLVFVIGTGVSCVKQGTILKYYLEELKASYIHYLHPTIRLSTCLPAYLPTHLAEETVNTKDLLVCSLITSGSASCHDEAVFIFQRDVSYYKLSSSFDTRTSWKQKFIQVRSIVTKMEPETQHSKYIKGEFYLNLSSYR